MNCTHHQVLIFLVTCLCSQMVIALNETLLSFNTTQNFVKNVSRARLWSPYSTIAFQLDSNASTSTISVTTLSPPSRQKAEEEHKVNSIPDEPPINPRQAPIISSIRHHKSRKSFTRTSKFDSDSNRNLLHLSTTQQSNDLNEDYHADQGIDKNIYGQPLEIQDRTKPLRKLNRITNLLSNTTVTVEKVTQPLESTVDQIKKTKSKPAALRKSKYKLHASPSPSPLSPQPIDLNSPSSQSQLSSKDSRLPVSIRLRSPDNNADTGSNYDDEIPLVFIPGVVPSFRESEESLYEPSISDDTLKNGPKEDEFVENDYEGENSPGDGSSPNEHREDMDVVSKFLRMVQEKTAENCTAGTEFTMVQGVVDRYAQERFQREAEVAVNRANMLTRLWKYARDVMSSEYLLHASVISMVEFDDDIFAAGNCYDERQYKNYTLFCPFAYRRPDGNIRVKDLAVEYKYLSNTSEFFYAARTNAAKVIKNFNQSTRGFHSYTYNESAHTEPTEEVILNVTYEDGKWSKPYFDCGGGNIWMMTYTVPFFDFQHNNYFFKGTSGIDIDLRRVDIDQCPLPANSTELNIFAASDKCKNATTKCVPIKGLGFRRGSYRCYCEEGFYFPNVSSPLKYFNGSLLEEEYENKFMGRVTRYDESGAFECLRCLYGCDSCIDDSPCVVSLNWLMRSAILILQIVIILMLPIVGLFTWKYAEVKVIRAASPVLLGFIVLGAFLIYCTILVLYPSPSIITCTLRVWLREIGFSLAYGALMLKTWRISVIFRVRSAKAVKITDLDLMKRLGIIVAMFAALLVIRTLVAPPVSIVHLTADNLKAWLCISDWWDHSFTIMELSFLVWGIRLCIVVRKAPSEFNESKFISLAIYNEFLLSLFLNISMLFLQSPPNPDLLYIIFFCHVQLTMTLLLCLIFGSKAYMVFRGHGKGSSSDESRNTAGKFITKARGGGPAKQTSISAQNSTGTVLHSNALLQDPTSAARLPEDIQSEFQRFYSQLEELKERNVKLGNRQLVDKIIAMQTAAVTLLSTVSDTDTNGFHFPSSLPSSTTSPKEIKGNKTTSTTPGKSNPLLRHISEEESTTAVVQALHSILDKAHPHLATPKTADRPEKPESGEKARTVCDVEIETIGSPVPTKTQDPEEISAISTDEEDELEYMDVDDYGEEDEVGNSIRNTVLIQDDENIQSSKGESGESETVPASVITSEATKDTTSTPEQVQTEQSEPIGNQTQTIPLPSSSDAGPSPSRSGRKLVLDLDDKSRFTEEISV